MFDPRQATVVVIDDDACLREALAVLLGSADYRSISYASAEEYLKHPPPEIPCCLLIDLHLPGMSGIALQQRLNNRQPRPPTVFISGDASKGEMEQAIAGGALDFLHKPFDTDTLLARTRRCLNQSLKRV